MKVLELTFFGVTSAGVIVLPDIPQPQIRSDVFELIDPRTIHSCQELIDLIESCQPLQEHFQILGQAHLQEHGHVAPSVESVLACRDAVNGSQRLILGALRRDPDTGWRQWIEYSGDAALQGFLDQVHEWLDDDIDWSESDHFDVVWNGQLAALCHFDALPAAIRNAVGVKIVDGDMPGSSYRAAELSKGIDEANQIAELLSQDFRFELAERSYCGGCHV